MVEIPGGTYPHGSERQDSQRDERPFRSVSIASFCLDVNEVTNERFIKKCMIFYRVFAKNYYSRRRFSEFVEATNHSTDAEIYGWSFVPDFILSSSVKVSCSTYSNTPEFLS
jgi:hypothetical protein